MGGAWRGRRLVAPEGETTRPTADRVRQALFDRLMHARWAGRAAVEGVAVLDGFAGTGALGLEALSRGAGRAVLFERDSGALRALRANVALCGAVAQCRVVAGDVLRPPAGPGVGAGCGLVFLDPPYGLGLVGAGLAALFAAGWVAAGALVLAEIGRDEDAPALGETVDAFTAGAARVVAYRMGE